MKNFAFTIFYCIISISPWFQANAQYKGKIKLHETFWDFGQVKEGQKNISKTFWYINEGRGNIKLTNVSSQCGCIISDWSKEEIQKGDSVFIKIELDLKDKKGHFDQIVLIQTDGFPELFSIKVSGEILKTSNPLFDKYPYSIGNLLFSEQTIYWGESIVKERKEKEILIYNNSNSIIEIEEHIPSLPKYLTASITPKTLAPQKEGKIKLELITENYQNRGFFMDLFHLYTNDSIERLKPLYQMGVIIDTQYHHINGLIPSLETNTTTLKFDKVISSKISEAEISFTNAGNGDLIIYKSQSTCPCLDLQFSNTIIKPGSKATAKVILDTINLSGQINKSIYVFTNDPKNPYLQIWVNAVIE